GLVEHGSDVRGRGPDEGPGTRRRKPREGRAPLWPGTDGVWIVELDERVGQFAAGAQLLHDEDLDLPVVRRSVRPDVEQHQPQWRDRIDAVRAGPSRHA